MIFFNVSLIFTQDLAVLCKKLCPVNLYMICESVDIQYSNKLAYLQLITVLVYGSSPPESR